MPLTVDVIMATEHNTPTSEAIKQWVTHGLQGTHPDAEVCVRIVDEEEISQLNQTYRKKNGANQCHLLPRGPTPFWRYCDLRPYT